MADTGTQNNPAPENATVVTVEQPATGSEQGLGEGGQKALKAERAARSAAEKSATALQAKLDEIEKANLSDLDRAKKEAQINLDAATAANAAALKWRIAARHGISDDDAETFLTGTDEASLVKQAERLVALATAALQNPGGPRPDLSQGTGNVLALNGDGLTDSLKNALGIR